MENNNRKELNEEIDKESNENLFPKKNTETIIDAEFTEDIEEDISDNDISKEGSLSPINSSFQENNQSNRNLEEEIDQEMVFNSMKKKNKKPLNKILFIAIIIVLVGIIFMLGLKFLSSGSSEQTPVVNEEFTKGEDISVQKAKEIVEEANKNMEGIQLTTTSEGKDSDISTTLPTLPAEEEKVDSNQPQDFVNNELGISFTYPSEWIEIFSFQGKQTPKEVKNVVMVGYPADSNIIDNMRISIEGTPLSITSKEYFSDTEELMAEVFPKFQLVNKGEMTVSGREAPTRTYVWVPQEELDRSPYEQEWLRIKQLQVYVAGNNKVYVVTFTGEEKLFDKNFEKYKEILSTLELGE